MAHSTLDSWKKFLEDAGIPSAVSGTYADLLVDNCMTDHHDLSREVLKDVGITRAGHIISILKYCSPPAIAAEQNDAREPRPLSGHRLPPPSKPPMAAAPQISAEMTHPEFRKFRWDWGIFKSLTALSTAQIAAQIYSNCDSSVQNSIINTASDYFTLSEDAILDLLERIVTKRSNPSIHRLAFSNLAQSENEPVKDFVVRLKSSARDCEFVCPNCNHDLVPVNVKDQLIRGLHNSTLQTDILAKSDTLGDLPTIVKHAESFEVAIHDQSKLQDSSDVMGARISEYKRMNQMRISNNWANQQPPTNQQQQKPYEHQRPPPSQSASRDNQKQHKGGQQQHKGGQQQQRTRICRGCGSTTHSLFRQTDCPAWGQRCHNCDTPNHFAKVCRQAKQERTPANGQPTRDFAAAIIAHVRYDQLTESFTSTSTEPEVKFVPAEMTPIVQGKRKTAQLAKIFPDSGADICLAGSKHLVKLGIRTDELITCRKTITAVGGHVLKCRGCLVMEFNISGNTTRQPLYICDRVDRIYFSRKGCKEVHILPSSFPFPAQTDVASIEPATPTHPMEPTTACTAPEPVLPPRPTALQFTDTEENIPKLKQYLIEKFEDTVFSRGTTFRSMNCPPAHIHLKDDAKPHAVHTPYSIPIHWRDEVKRLLDRDVEDGIIEPVPIGDPVVWCSPMVVTAKSDGNPR